MSWEDDSPNWTMNASVANTFNNIEVDHGWEFPSTNTTMAAEEFVMGEEAAKILAEDDDLFNDRDLDLQQVSVRWDDQTYMNMTIGTYMAAGSESWDKVGFDVDSSSSFQKLSPPMKENQKESSPWLRLSSEESLPHSPPLLLDSFVGSESPQTPDETLPNSPPVSLVSATEFSLNFTRQNAETSSSSSHDDTVDEMHRMICAGEVTCSNVTMFLGELKKKRENRRAAQEKKEKMLNQSSTQPIVIGAPFEQNARDTTQSHGEQNAGDTTQSHGEQNAGDSTWSRDEQNAVDSTWSRDEQNAVDSTWSHGEQNAVDSTRSNVEQCDVYPFQSNDEQNVVDSTQQRGINSYTQPKVVESPEALILDHEFKNLQISGSLKHGAQMPLVLTDCSTDFSSSIGTRQNEAVAPDKLMAPMTVPSHPSNASADSKNPKSPFGTVQNEDALSDTQIRELSTRDESKFLSLLPDTTDMSLLQDSVHQLRDFVASTPLVGQKRGAHCFSGATPLDQHSIHYLFTPCKQSQLISVPGSVNIPDVCCVMLGQQTQFPVGNKHKRGIKCRFSIRQAKLNRKAINLELCPFEIKQQVTLQPGSEEQVEVLFTPKDQGHFWALLEVHAQTLTSPLEERAYTVILQGQAEFPLLKVSPKNEFLDFGDVVWGNCAYRCFKIQNVGQATVPIRFSIFRTNSSLCNFSFCSDQSCDVSTISLTQKPESVSSVISMSLPGRKEGEEIETHVIRVCCQVKDIQKADRKYSEKSENFQAVLHIDVDLPLNNHSHLSQMKMVVNAGMVKLHTDQDRLDLYTLPNEVAHGSMRVLNSGNIPMQVTLRLDPQVPAFHLKTPQMTLGPQVWKMVEIEYRPQLSQGDEATTCLTLFDQLAEYTVPVVGHVSMKSKIRSSTSSLSFGGVDIGEKKTEKFTLLPDRDIMLQIWIKDGNGTFQLFNEDGEMEEKTMVSVKKKMKYTIMVSFYPTQVQFYSQLLCIQAINADKFTVPLLGYGGLSKVEVTGVDMTDNGRYVIDFGQITRGSSIVRKLLVTNHGVRNAYVKAVACDISRKELSPQRASVMPSRLFLEPKESKELILMLNPSEAEIKLCTSGRSLVTIIKLLHGDEITRQILLRSNTAQAKTLALDFDIPLTAKDRDSQFLEAIMPVRLGQEVHWFKNAMKSMKIGLVAQTVIPEKLPQSLPSPVKMTAAHRKAANESPRSALQPVNQNVGEVNSEKNIWSLSPLDIQLTVFDSQSKEFALINNFSNKEMRFVIECDDVLKVIPSKGIVKSKSFVQLAIHPSETYWSRREKSSCGLVKVISGEDKKYLRVLVLGVPETSSSHQGPGSDLLDCYGSKDRVAVETQKPTRDSFPQGQGHNQSSPLVSSASSQGSVEGTGHKQKPADLEHPSSSKAVSLGKATKEVKQLPVWVAVSADGGEKSCDRLTGSMQKKDDSARNNPRGGMEDVKAIGLEQKHLHFGPIHTGEKLVQELHITNPTDKDAEIIVEQEPGPPFSIRRSHFKIGKGRMIIYPVTFKPSRVGKYTTRIILRAKDSRMALTASIEGECIK